MTGANGQGTPQEPSPYAPPQASAYYAPPGAHPRPAAKPPSRWMAITALSIVIPAALLRFVPFVGGLFIVPVLVAMVFAVLALVIQKSAVGMSVAALVIGVVGLIVPIVLTVLRLSALGLTIFGVLQEGGWQP